MNKAQVLDILSRHQVQLQERGVGSLSLFGSVARDQAGPESDVDLLVEFDRPVGLFEFVGLKEYLEELLGCRVDLATPRALRPQMRERVLREAVRQAKAGEADFVPHLRLRTDAWYQRQERVNYHMTSAALTELKKQPEHSWLNEVSSVPLQQTLRQLQYKADWYGRTVIGSDRWYPSSKRCFDCGWVNEALTLDDRTWTCQECGSEHDRDVNAAKTYWPPGRRCQPLERV